MDSSGAPAEMRRRAEEELRGERRSTSLHGSAAKRTSPQRGNGRRRRRRGSCNRSMIGSLKQPQTKRKEFCSPPVGEKAEVANAHETAR